MGIDIKSAGCASSPGLWLILLVALTLGHTPPVAAQQGLEILDISERAYDGGNALSVTFSEALDGGQNLDDYLKVTVNNVADVDGSWILSDNLKVVYFSNTEPEVHYQIHVYRGLRARSGATLERSIEKSLRTRKIVPSVRFAGTEVFMPIALKDGLSVEATNVPEVNVDFFRVRESRIADFLKFMRERRGNSWYNYYMRQLTPFGELAYSGRFELPSEANKRRIHNLALGDISALSQPGIYFAVMSQPGVYGDYFNVTYFSKTDLGLHARLYQDQIDVYLSSIASGKALANVAVSIVDNTGNELVSRRTDADGFVSFTAVGSNARVIQALHREHFSFLSLQGPALDLSQFDIGKHAQRKEEIFIYGPRDLYRPGEVVELSALRRNHDGMPLGNIPLAVKILRPDRAVASSFTWHAEQEGYYSHRYPLPQSASTGNWTVQVSGIEDSPVEYEIKVEDFLPERMEIEFNNGSAEAIVVDERQGFEIPVSGRYLHGAPASGNRLDAFVQARKGQDLIESLKGYEFGHLAGELKKPIKTGDIKLDQEGKGTIKLFPEWRDVQAALEVVFVTSLYESGGRPVSRAYSAYIWPEREMIGISPDFGKENPAENSRPGFKIVKSNFNGERFAATNLEARLVREDRQYFWEYNESRGWHWNWTESEYPVYTEIFDITAELPAQLKVPVEYGRYRLEIHDPANNNQVSSVRFHAGEDWYYWWQRNNTEVAAPRPDRVNLALDAAAYQPGDLARLRIVSPHAGQAIVTVESDRQLWFQRLTVEAGGSTVEIPVGEDWDRHDIYVTAVVFKPGDSNNFISPNRAIGIAHLPLDRSARRLEVSIDTRDKLLPDKTHEFGIRVDGVNSATSKYVTLAAVDVGVLAISDFETPDPHQGFFGQRRYKVDQRDIYNRIMDLHRSKKAALKFGGDAMLAKGGEAARAEVQIVSLFSGLVSLDDNGEARVPLDLPEFNGRLRLMAVAFDATSFGSAEREVTVASPVVAEISMPRFMAFNDEAVLALDLGNLSGEAQELKVEVRTTDPLQLVEKVKQTVQLDNNQRRIIRFRVRADDEPGKGEIRLRVAGSNMETIERSWKLAVRSAYPAVTRTTSQLLRPGDSLALANSVDMDDYREDSLQALVSVSTEANLRLQENLRYLIRYPYGCLEQTTSSAYPLAFSTASNLAQVGIDDYGQSDIQERIDVATKGLSGLQKANGGFGLWDSNSREEEWLTAYAVDFLLTARGNGFSISNDMLVSALSRLENYVRRSGTFTWQRYSEKPGHYAFAAKAYSAYLLAGLNRMPLGALRSLYDNEAANADSPLPLLHISLALRLQGDSQRAQQAFERAMAFPQADRRVYLGDYGSRIRDLGQMIHLLIKHDIEVVKAREMAFTLEREVRNKYWLSTQERNALFLAGISLQRLPSGDWSAEIDVGNNSYAMDSKRGGDRLFRTEDIADRFMLVAGKGDDIFASISVSGYLKRPPKPESSAMSIRKNYFDSDGNPIDLGNVRSGDLVLVDLVISAQQRSPDALVVDLLPAGFELENQNLKHSVSLENFSIDGLALSKLQETLDLKYQEFRDDRYIAAIDLGRRREVHLVYPMRAVTPGDYAVPAVFVEDMYRPENRAVGRSVGKFSVREAN